MILKRKTYSKKDNKSTDLDKAGKVVGSLGIGTIGALGTLGAVSMRKKKDNQ